MPGYRSDQFSNLQDTAGTYQSRQGSINSANIGADNQKFIYPDKTIRTDDAAGAKNIQLQRGYIRSLLEFGGVNSTKTRKCQFQFNPTQLLQSVQQNTSLLNFMQQDPAQWAQPVPSSANFTFTLQFDRSMELNNPDGQQVFTNSATDDIWAQNSPSQVGVLHDMGVLFSVIGQGFSGAMRDQIAKTLATTVYAENAAAAATASTAITTTSTAQSAANLSKVDSNLDLNNPSNFVDINLGNSGFLVPIPVRVVFSSLYVVEGFVQGTTVSFTKFNTAMVPMQCAVTVTMEAKYIGFSKAKTFLTVSLADRTLQANQDATKLAADQTATLKAAREMVGSVTLRALSPEDWRNTSIFSSTHRNLTFTEVSTGDNSLLGCGIHPAKETRTENDPMKVLFDAGSMSSVALSGKLTVWGPFNSFSNFVRAGDIDQNYAIEAEMNSLGTTKDGTKWFESNITESDDGATAADGDSWRILTGGKKDRDACGSPYNDIQVFSHTRFPVNGPAFDTSKYYVIRGIVSVTATASSSAQVIGSGEFWKVIRADGAGGTGVFPGDVWPSDPGHPHIAITVPVYFDSGIVAPVVVNSSSGQQPPAGSTSNVGKPSVKPRSGAF